LIDKDEFSKFFFNINKIIYATFLQDGYILCVFGPFLSDYQNNDASIFKNCLSKNEQDILNWLHKDDVIIADRGFRDAVGKVKQFGYEIIMPSFINRKKQFSTEEANHTRLVTKVRWVIESGIV
jgi:hypothetical protein